MLKKKYNHQTLVIDSLDDIPSYEIASLSVGDVVDWGGDLYIISHKTDNESIFLVNATDEEIVTAIYLFNAETKAWEFEEVTVTPIGGGGLEVIEWDGERNFTEEEISKLKEFKAVVFRKYSDETTTDCFIPSMIDEDVNVVYLSSVSVQGGSASDIYTKGICIYEDGTFESYNASLDEYEGTKLFKHLITLNQDGDYISFITNDREAIPFANFLSNIETIFENSISAKFNFKHHGTNKIKGEVCDIYYNGSYSKLDVGCVDIEEGLNIDSINVANLEDVYVDTVTKL